jgi:hypothetical protein
MEDYYPCYLGCTFLAYLSCATERCAHQGHRKLCGACWWIGEGVRASETDFLATCCIPSSDDLAFCSVPTMTDRSAVLKCLMRFGPYTESHWSTEYVAIHSR